MLNAVASAPHSRRRVFISYARADGMEFARNLYRELVETHKISVWQDIVDLESGGDTWPSQIDEAIKNVEYLALVLTPGAERSANVLKEWRLARQEGVCVLPIISDPNLMVERMPRWIRKQHLVDPLIPEQWNSFIATLADRCTEPRVPFMVGKGLPEVFVERPVEFGKVIDLLVSDDRQEPLAITAALRSFGGYGKTALASAICLNEQIRNAFGDGILWVTLGDTVDEQGLVRKVNELIFMLSREQPGFSSIEPAESRLSELLADHDVLIVIDDVWHRANLDPFLKGGINCARLITTRDKSLLPYGSKRVDVDAMRHEESVELLGYALEGAGLLSEALGALANRLGHWPQLLSMVNGVLRGRVNDGDSLVDALEFVNKDLDDNGLTTFDENDENRQRAVGITLDLSLQRLSDEQRTRFLDLAIFPENVNIPLAMVFKLWNHATPQYTATLADKLCGKLSDLSLLRNRDLGPKRSIRLQDVIHLYIGQLQSQRLSLIHDQLLDACRPCDGQSSSAGLSPWADLPVAEEYLWDYLTFHLFEAGRYDELLETVTNWPYLAQKIRVRDSLAIDIDLRQALKGGLDEELFARLQRVFANTEQLFLDLAPDDVQAALFARLHHLRDSLKGIPSELPSSKSSFISVRWDFPDLLPAAGQRGEVDPSHESHRGLVSSCDYQVAAKRVVSASADQTLKVWDEETGMVLSTFEGHIDSVNDCAFSPKGDRIVSASSDRTVRVWDVDSQEGRVFDKHSGSVNGCAFSPDGNLIVSASSDRTLIIWNAQDGQIQRTLRREEIWVEIRDEKGKPVLDADDKPIQELIEVPVDGHSGAVNECAFSPDGRSVVSASDDQTLKLWNLESAEVSTLRGHSNVVNRCAFSHDGKLIVSASSDKTLRIWNAETHKSLGELKGHSDPVNGCSFSADDESIISASSDGTLRVWEVSSGKSVATFYDQSEMYCCQMHGDMLYGGGTRGLYFLSLVR